MNKNKSILRYSELCEAIEAGATLCKKEEAGQLNYSLRLTEEQAAQTGSAIITVGRQIGKKFSETNKTI